MPNLWLFIWAAIAIIVLGIDAWIYYRRPDMPTLTRAIRSWPQAAWWIGLMVGTIAGHLWWCVCY